jgi:hypothetical protein
VAEWLKARAEADQRSLAFVVMQVCREQMLRETKAKARTKPKS